MTSPWDLYDQLIDEIPADITKGEASEQIERLRKETGKD